MATAYSSGRLVFGSFIVANFLSQSVARVLEVDNKSATIAALLPANGICPTERPALHNAFTACG
jgi:hypothetical protein